ncbi:alpha/beta hydrolase family protein [Phenylobacterium sp.]|uniref:alpha/beta hydrolase family protein n=1 Tax=Phenylobacterium sp. TaxID=1871053 RepID=UPI002FC781D8
MIARRLAAFILAVCATPAFAAPLEVYGKLPSIEDVTISPDGARLALIATNGEQRRIVMKDLATGQVTGMIVGEAKVRDLRWASSDHLLITTSTTARIQDVIAPRGEWRMLFSYDVKTQKMRQLLRDADNGLNVLAGSFSVRMVDNEPLVFAEGWRFDSTHRGRIALFRIELKRGESKVVHGGFPGTRDWLVAQDGEALAESGQDPASGRWQVRIKDGAAWRELAGGTALHGGVSLMGLGRGADTLLVGTQDDQDLALVRELRRDGTWSEPLIPGDATPVRDPATHQLIGHSERVGDDLRYTFFDPRDQRTWRSVEAAYPGEAVHLISWSADRKKLVVLVDSKTEGPDYALVDLGAKKATWIGGLYENLGAGDVAPVRPLKFKAKDGLELSGYLTTPLGRPAKGLPLVVLPHGGPAARDTPVFDWWAQALASRGYAVLQVNFRGSDGLGADLLTAGYGEWGRKMQTDLSDGVRHLAGQGVIDPKRVCIVGGSYGGYAALAGPSLDPGVYRCAASFGGVADPKSMVEWSRDKSGVAARRYWLRFMGAKDTNDPRLAEISPVVQAAKVDTPILLIHGRDDTVVPFQQSRLMNDALIKAGKSVQLVSLPGEDHWLSRGETRLAMLNAVVAFLEKHNPPN